MALCRRAEPGLHHGPFGEDCGQKVRIKIRGEGCNSDSDGLIVVENQKTPSMERDETKVPMPGHPDICLSVRATDLAFAGESGRGARISGGSCNL